MDVDLGADFFELFEALAGFAAGLAAGFAFSFAPLLLTEACLALILDFLQTQIKK